MDRAEREREREGRKKSILSLLLENLKIRVFGFEWRGDDAPP